MTDQAKHKAQTISGLRWTILDQIINQITVFGIGFLLMQSLPPSSFGLLGMVTVFSGFLSVFKDFGLGSSLIQKKNINKLEINTVYWFTVLLGLFLTTSFFLASPLIARYYEEPSLAKIARVISFLFLIQSLSSVHLSLMRKQMLFKKIFVIQVSSTILSGLAALVLAYGGHGVWALVFQQIIKATLLTTFIFIAKSFLPRLSVKAESLNEHLNFSLPLVGRGALNYWARNADNFFIGSNLGAEFLGIYSRAYSFMMLPISRISGVISSVMFPSFSIIQEDHDRLKDIFLKLSRLISFITLPMMLGLTYGANSFVKLFFKEEWFAMIGVLEVLAMVGAIQSIGTLNGNIFLAKGKTLFDFKLSTFNSLVYIIGFYFSSKISLMQVVIIYSISNWIILGINWYFLAKILRIKFKILISNFSFQLSVFISLYLLFQLTRRFWQNAVAPIIELSLVCFTVSFVWLAIFMIFRKDTVTEAKSMLFSLIRRENN